MSTFHHLPLCRHFKKWPRVSFAWPLLVCAVNVISISFLYPVVHYWFVSSCLLHNSFVFHNWHWNPQICIMQRTYIKYIQYKKRLFQLHFEQFACCLQTEGESLAPNQLLGVCRYYVHVDRLQHALILLYVISFLFPFQPI